MGRHSADEYQTSSRGVPLPSTSHRAPPQSSGPWGFVAHTLGKTVPKRVPPPRFHRVLFLSGLTVALALSAYSSTQVYLHFSDPRDEASGQGDTAEAPPDALAPQPPPDGEGRDGIEVSPDHAASGDSRVQAEVGYSMERHATNEFSGELTISNVGDAAMDDWDLELTFEEAEVLVVWGAEWEPKTGGARISPSASDMAIEPGRAATIGFDADGSAEVPRCRLNGHSCGLSD